LRGDNTLSPFQAVPNSFQWIDQILLQQVEELCSGENVHLHANLSGTYRSAVDQYRLTGDEEYRVIAEEAHQELRVLLAKLRYRKALFVHWL
jgi:hypothetical protein